MKKFKWHVDSKAGRYRCQKISAVGEKQPERIGMECWITTDSRRKSCITMSIISDRSWENEPTNEEQRGSYNVVPSHELVTQTRPLRAQQIRALAVT